MGKTAFSGPVYGAKCGLMTLAYAGGAISSNASTTLVPASAFQVPTYEQWVITSVYIQTSTCSSNAAQFIVKYESPSSPGGTLDGRNTSTTSGALVTINSGTSTSIATRTSPTTTPGEYEGLVLQPNSTIRIVSSANSAMGVTQINIHGFIRYIEAANRTV